MNILSNEELNSHFYIYEDLAPSKSYKTQVAFWVDSNITSPVILKEMDEKRATIYEALTSMWNPYIANVYSVYQISPQLQSKLSVDINRKNLQTSSPSSEKYLAITENVGEISLTEYVRSKGILTAKQALSISIQLCEGLSEFHRKGYVHRDIKPDNIMMASTDPEDLQIKIIDFGGAKELRNDTVSDTTVIGTLGYQAPESLSAATRNTADIFSIGCVLNFLLTGQEPGIKRYTEKSNIASIIEKATRVDPSSRYSSVDALKRQLLHEKRFYKLDRIPIIRSIPGIRTHTYWKMFIASFGYISAMYILAKEWMQHFYAETFMLFFFHFFVPLVAICNLGNLQRFLPFSIRSNSKKSFFLKLICVFTAFWIPLIINSFFN